MKKFLTFLKFFLTLTVSLRKIPSKLNTFPQENKQILRMFQDQQTTMVFDYKQEIRQCQTMELGKCKILISLTQMLREQNLEKNQGKMGIIFQDFFFLFSQKYRVIFKNSQKQIGKQLFQDILKAFQLNYMMISTNLKIQTLSKQKVKSSRILFSDSDNPYPIIPPDTVNPTDTDTGTGTDTDDSDTGSPTDINDQDDPNAEETSDNTTDDSINNIIQTDIFNTGRYQIAIKKFCANQQITFWFECDQFCPQECASCSFNLQCTSCAEFYVLNEEGQCVIEDEGLAVLAASAPIVSAVMRFQKFRMIMLVLDELWLYQYHKKEYTKFPKKIFKTIRFIEQKKYSIVGLDKLEFINDIKKLFPNFNPFSNIKYVLVERKDNLIFRSTLQFLLTVLPCSFVFFFLINRLFFCLFNFQISKYIRLFSFKGYIFQLFFENNIQFFTFLAMRNFLTPFSFSFQQKIMQALAIMSFFFIFLFAISIYYIYRLLYQKLSKYFLDNTYRIHGSFGLMTFLFGIRPLLKGATHGLVYEDNELQLYLLMSIQFLTLFTVLFSHFKFDNFISKTALCLDIVYYTSFGIFNFLLILSQDIANVTQIDEQKQKAIDVCLESVAFIISFTMISRTLFLFFYCPKSPPKEDEIVLSPGVNKKVKFIQGEKNAKERITNKKQVVIFDLEKNKTQTIV